MSSSKTLESRVPFPLMGVTVIDVSTVIAGPMAAMTLGDYGARVVKVEHPKGDTMRHGEATRYLGRNKESITCNLSNPAGAALFRKLASRADVIIENFRPGTMARWGLGYETLKQANPGLIMLHLSGFGQDGPYASRPGYGALLESMCGLTYVTGESETPPVAQGQPVADPQAALTAVIAILMALRARDTAPEHAGDEIDLSLYNPMLSLMGASITEYFASGREPSRGQYLGGGRLRCIGRCQDEKWAMVVAVDERKRTLLQDFLESRGYERRPVTAAGGVPIRDIAADLRHFMSARTRETALREMVAADIPAGPINSIAEVAAHDLFQARGDFIPYPDGNGGTFLQPRPSIRFGRLPMRAEFAGREIGEHNKQVLVDWLGLTSDEVQELAAAGAI